MSISTVHSAVRVFPIGAPVPVDALDPVIHSFELLANEARYEKDEEIFGEGSLADHVYQVIGGAVRSYKLLADGRCQITAFHLPGDVFGMDCSATRRMTADAIVESTIRVVRRRSLEQAAATDPCIGRSLWAMASRSLEHAEEHLLLLGRKTAVERVAAFLLEMDRRLSGTGMLPLPMYRRDIGDYLGLTLETVSRALSLFHDQGILEFSGARHIILKNRPLLRGMEI
jgi:CRP/FNR family transcriptional regulator, nitrogen fixation regulation protein